MDTAYLKKAVGDQLAKGIAHVCEVLPSDPVEYLALWLLHEIQLEEVKARRQIESDELERLRKEVEKEQLIKQDAAAKVIQSEMKNFLQKREEQKRKQQEEEEQLRIQEEELRRQLEEESQTLVVDSSGKSEVEVEAEKGRLLGEKKFKMAQQLLLTLDKDKIDQMKRMSAPKKPIIKVLKCCLLILDTSAKQVKTWDEIRGALKTPSEFLKQLLAYDPTQKQKKNKFVRIGKLLASMDEATVKKTATSCYLLYQWLVNALELRKASVEERKALKKEEEDEEEEEEEEKDDDQDLSNE